MARWCARAGMGKRRAWIPYKKQVEMSAGFSYNGFLVKNEWKKRNVGRGEHTKGSRQQDGNSSRAHLNLSDAERTFGVLIGAKG